jgi:hypothetical protein
MCASGRSGTSPIASEQIASVRSAGRAGIGVARRSETSGLRQQVVSSTLRRIELHTPVARRAHTTRAHTRGTLVANSLLRISI